MSSSSIFQGLLLYYPPLDYVLTKLKAFQRNKPDQSHAYIYLNHRKRRLTSKPHSVPFDSFDGHHRTKIPVSFGATQSRQFYYNIFQGWTSRQYSNSRIIDDNMSIYNKKNVATLLMTVYL